MSDPNGPVDPTPNDGSIPTPPPPSWGETPAAPPAPVTPPRRLPRGTAGTPAPVAPPAPPAPSWGATPPAPPAPAAPPAYAPPPQPASPYAAPPAPGSAYPPAGPSGFPTQDAGFPPAPAPGGFPPAPGQGGFPPAGGGFPPAPGGYPAPAPGFGAAGYQQPADISSAFSWGWNKFTANWGVLVLAHLLWGLVVGAIAFILFGILGALAGTATVSDDGALSAGASLGIGFTIVLLFVVVLVAFVSNLAIINGYLAIADGRTPVLKDFFVFRNVGAGVIAGLIIALASSLLYITFIGPLAIAFFTVFALYFVVDRNLDAISSIKASIQVALKNPAQVILLILVTALLGSVGAAICFVGALVTIPLSGLLTVYLYRRLSGGQVAA